jgi:hypothetical protein
MTASLRTAIVYDFDGTLTPHNLPEHSFLPAVRVTDSQAFWDRVHKEARAQDGCQILASMNLMLEAARRSGVEVTRAMLRRHGQDIPLFAGVSD